MTSDQSDVTKTVIFADPPGTNNFISAEVPIADLNEDMMDVAFTKAVGCTQYPNGGCDGMRKDHRFADAVPLGENWRHKYLIDLDGMGYSARLFSLVRQSLNATNDAAQIRKRSDEDNSLHRVHVRVDPAMAALHPRVANVQRNLQHLRILLRTFPSDEGIRQRDTRPVPLHRSEHPQT